MGAEAVVLGLPRGGVPVASEVAAALDAPLDVLVVRKLGAPFNRELAVGAIATGGVVVYNRWLLNELGLDEEALAPILDRERAELARRERVYRGSSPPVHVAHKTVILVDDGAATGATMHAGIEAIRALGATRVVVALPTSSREAVNRLAEAADELVVISVPEPYMAVGAWYELFDQLSDADVAECLARARGVRRAPDSASEDVPGV
jgi:predicted phosphoribosyltransferase